jgi:CheY-like chemotaxis protein
MPPRPSRPTVLVVDDNAETADLVHDFLTGEGYAVAGAADPDTAIARLRRGGVAVVLTDSFAFDLAHPFDATRPLRAAAGPIPVVLVTAYRLERDEALAAGFADCLPKPFDLDALLACIRARLD